MGIDGTLTLCIPRRQVELHWWLPAGGDPSSLAGRFASLDGPWPVTSRRRRLPAPSPSASGERHGSLGDRLLRCLDTAAPLDRSPAWIDPIHPDRDRPRGSAPLPGARSSLRHHPSAQRPLRALLEACLAVPPEATIPAPPWPPRPMSAGFHARLTLQCWHLGPLWISLWRCHRLGGWQRRCGPMLLSDFLVHQNRLPLQSARQSGAALRRSFPHGS